MTHVWESTKAPLPSLCISCAMYQACRKARPDIAWDDFPDADIQVRGGSVLIVEDTPAANDIRESMAAMEPEDS